MNAYVEGVREVVERWKREASTYEERGMDREARMIRSYASELSRTLDQIGNRRLTLDEAAEESGMAYSTLQQEVAGGRIPNAGQKGAPRILRKDLPRFAGRQPRVTGSSDDAPDLARETTLARRLRRV